MDDPLLLGYLDDCLLDLWVLHTGGMAPGRPTTFSHPYTISLILFIFWDTSAA